LGGYLGLKHKEYQNNNQEALKYIDNFLNACKYVFEDDFYLEIRPSFMQDQINYNKFIIKLSTQYNIKVIYTTDSHYLSKNHRQIHKSFLNSKEGEREVDDFYASTYVMTKEEIWE
jgi:DNA polymerase-3 subunit alpha